MGLPGPLGLEGFVRVVGSEFRDTTGSGDGSGVALFVGFVENASGGALSESGELQSSGAARAGGWVVAVVCRDEESSVDRVRVVESFEPPSRPPGRPLFRLLPRPLARSPFALRLGSSSRGRLANRGLSSNGSCPRAVASSRLAFLSATCLAVGNLFFRSAIQASISSGVFKATLVPWMTMGFLRTG